MGLAPVVPHCNRVLLGVVAGLAECPFAFKALVSTVGTLKIDIDSYLESENTPRGPPCK
jgi:hypothetical protein